MKIVKKVLIKIKKNILGFVVGFTLTASITVAFATDLLSSSVSYDNTDSGLSSTTVQGALDELNEMAENSSGGMYVYAYNTSKIYYTGANQSTLNSIGTVYGTMQALTTAVGNVFGLKYKIENNMITEAYACILFAGVETCLQGSTDGATHTSNIDILTNDSYWRVSTIDTDYYSALRRGTWENFFGRTESNGRAVVTDWWNVCEVNNAGYAYCYEDD